MKINDRGYVEQFTGELNSSGTCFQGYFDVSYKELKKIFGEPNGDGGYKTDAQWVIQTPSGVATIYNYKDGKSYLGTKGTPKTKITEWHIGGADKNTYAWVAFAIFNN